MTPSNLKIKRGSSSEKFLRSFFEANGKHPHPEKALQHFTDAFVPPAEEKMASVISALSPEEGKKKIFILDGHPRSGKTWQAVAACSRIIDEKSYDPENWWTSGVDSLGIYADGRDYVHDAASYVASELKDNKSLKLVVLDDFLGTNSLRLFGRTKTEEQSVESFLDWKRESNRWLEALPLGCTLVMTARSIFMNLAEALLNCTIRPRKQREEFENVILENRRCGVFQDINGEITGSHNRNSLRQLCELNLQHHPFKNRKENLLRATPLLAFASSLGLGSEFLLDDELKGVAANVFFGEDIGAIADQIKRLELSNSYTSGPDSDGDPRLRRLDTMYLLCVAPGLFYLGADAYRSLHFDTLTVERLSNDLYFQKSLEDLKVGDSRTALMRSRAVPNELYPIALQDHLRYYVRVVESAFARKINERRDKARPLEEHVGIGLRGILERQLHNKSRLESGDYSPKKTVLKHDREWEQLCTQYITDNRDSFLYWELHGRKNRSSKVLFRKGMNPGLAAAIGWTVYRFGTKRKALSPQACEEIIKVFLDHFRTSQNSWAKQTHREDADKAREFDLIVASYSTLLQWAIRGEIEVLKRKKNSPASQEAAGEGMLEFVLAAATSDVPEIQKLLDIVKEDELLWASTLGLSADEEHKPIREFRDIPDVQVLLTRIRDDCQPNAQRDQYLRTNQFFSIAWHNEWREYRRDELYAVAMEWETKHRDAALQSLETQPGIIDANLTYHWYHFITQHASWTRNWCFEPNLFEYERRRIAPGSANPDHNIGLCEILSRVLTENCTPERLRNMFMLVGSRAKFMPEGFYSLLNEVSNLVDGNDERADALLQAIFELARQGYLDVGQSNTTQGFFSWCVSCLEKLEARVDPAWSSYLKELDRVTYLDPLPSHWDEIKPRLAPG